MLRRPSSNVKVSSCGIFLSGQVVFCVTEIVEPPCMIDPPAVLPVIVLGMHRSGTSLLTGSLDAAEVFLGEVNQAQKNALQGTSTGVQWCSGWSSCAVS